MPRLILPDNTTVTTVGLGDGRGASVIVEAVDVTPVNSTGRMTLSMGWGDENMARLSISAYKVPYEEEPVILQLAFWSYGTRYLLGYQYYNASRMRWWRLRECFNYLEISVSADCSEWFTVALVEPRFGTDPDWFRGMNVQLSNANSGRPAIFDNLNILPRLEADPSVPRARTLNFMRARTTGSFSGAGVKGAILDQGVSDAVRNRQGITLYKKSIPTGIAQEGFTNAPDTVTGIHGCLVSSCYFPPGSLMHDIIISGRDGSSSDSLIAYGILEAIEGGAHVVNCSYGGGDEQKGRILRYAVEQAAKADVLLFFSSGNAGYNALAWPSALSAAYKNLHSVGAFDERTGLRADFSQYGAGLTGVTPGYFVKGLMPDGTDITWNGTSAASPHAARIALLLLTGDAFTAEQVGQAMKDQRRQLDVASPEAGGGAYDFAAALVYLQPHDTDGGMIPYTVFPPASVKRGVPGRSGSATVDVQAIPPTAIRTRKDVDSGAMVIQALDQTGPYPFGAQHPVYLTVGPEAVALPQAKGLSAEVVVTAVPRPPDVLRPRKHVSSQVTAEVAPVVSSYETLHWSPLPREAQDYPFEFLPTEIRFIAQEILTRKWLHMDLPIVDAEITWNLSGPFELTGTLKPPYPDIVDIGIDEWTTFIHVEYRGIILGTGILMPYTSTANEMSIEAIGITSYPNGLPYLETYAEFFPDMMDVVRELWRHIQSFPNGNMGVLLPEGKMGMPLFGDAVYDDTTGELLGYERWKLVWTDFPDCGSLIDDFAQSAPFDYNEVHAWKKDHSDILHGIDFGYPRLGYFRNDLRFVENENILDTIPIAAADDGYASDVIVKGAGEGYDQVYAYVATSIWNRLRRVEIITDERVTSVDMGNDLATAELIRRLLSRGVSEVTVEAFHPHASIGYYEVGDDILIEAYQPWFGEFALWHRITSIKFSPETGLATLKVQRSESVRYGLWSYG